MSCKNFHQDIAAIVYMVGHTYIIKKVYICYTSQYRYICHVKIIHHIGLTIAVQSWWQFLRDILIRLQDKGNPENLRDVSKKYKKYR